MRHVYLTCKNHPTLRWSTKEIAVNSDGTYNGSRNIFFLGELTGTPEYWSDMSGISGPFKPRPECSCPASALTFAPEDVILKAAWDKKYPAE